MRVIFSSNVRLSKSQPARVTGEIEIRERHLSLRTAGQVGRTAEKIPTAPWERLRPPCRPAPRRTRLFVLGYSLPATNSMTGGMLSDENLLFLAYLEQQRSKVVDILRTILLPRRSRTSAA